MKSLLKLGVTLALIALIIWQLGGIAPLIEAVADMRWAYVPLLIGLAIADRALMTFKWLLLLRAQGVHVPFCRALTIYCVSSFWGQVLPMTVGGDVVRLWLTTRLTSALDTVVASIAMERLLGFVAALLVGLVGLLILGEVVELGADLSRLWWAAIAVVAAGVAAFVLSLSQTVFDATYRLMPMRLSRTKLVQRVQQMHQAYLDYRRHRRSLQSFFCLTLVEQLMPILFVWLAARAFDVELSMLVAAGVVPLATLVTRIPISLAGIGVYEGAFMLLLPLAGVSQVDAVSMALVDRVIQVIAMAPWWLGAAIAGKSLAPPASRSPRDV